MNQKNNKKSKTASKIRTFLRNQYTIGVIVGIIIVIIASVINEILDYRNEKAEIIATVAQGDNYLLNKDYLQALNCYNNILPKVSALNDLKTLRSVYTDMGVCYFELSSYQDMEQNILLAITNFSGALKSYSTTDDSNYIKH